MLECVRGSWTPASCVLHLGKEGGCDCWPSEESRRFLERKEEEEEEGLLSDPASVAPTVRRPG